ncbi:MAG: hypothetical protein HY808_15415 [Nitrospirae bacterium]|nr:hypothetical protein [Nitrospirota bacterium]
MSNLRAFVGHSFTDNDKDVVREFLDFFDRVQRMGLGFTWDHAEPAAPKILSEKVLRLMEDKNLFIAICTAKEQVIDPKNLKESWLNKTILKAKKDAFNWKTSDWIIQEIGVAVGKKMEKIILLEEGLRKPGGLQGDLEYILFKRNEPSKSFNKIIEMLTALSPKETLIKASQSESSEKTEIESIQQGKEEKVEPSAAWGKNDYDFALFRAIRKDDKEQEQKIIKAYNDSEEGQKDSNKASFEALKYYFRRLHGKGIFIEELKALANKHPNKSEISYYLGKAYEEYKDNDKAAVQYETSAEHAQSLEDKLDRYCDAAVAKCKNGSNNSEDWLLNNVRTLIPNPDGWEFRLLRALRDIAAIGNNNDKYLAFTERMLDIKPDDKDSRFSNLSLSFVEVGRTSAS